MLIAAIKCISILPISKKSSITVQRGILSQESLCVCPWAALCAVGAMSSPASSQLCCRLLGRHAALRGQREEAGASTLDYSNEMAIDWLRLMREEQQLLSG